MGRELYGSEQVLEEFVHYQRILRTLDKRCLLCGNFGCEQEGCAAVWDGPVYVFARLAEHGLHLLTSNQKFELEQKIDKRIRQRQELQP